MRILSLKSISLLLFSILMTGYLHAQDFQIQSFKFPTFRSVGNVYADGETIWVGTENGVAKFDGVSFEFLDETNGLPIDSVMDMVRDPRNVLWFVGNQGVASLKDGHWDYYYPDQYSYGFVDRTGDDIWFSYADSGLLRITGTDTTTYALNENVWLNGVQKDSQGKFWGYGYNGLFHLENDTWVHDTLSVASNTMHIDKDGTQWVPGWGFLYKRMAGESAFETVEFPWGQTVSVTSITSDENGTLYMGTWSDGMIIKAGDTWYKVDTSDGLLSNYVVDVDVDSFGNVWMSNFSWQTWESGLSVLVNEDWFSDADALHGVIFHDVDNNGQQNGTEPGVPNQFIQLQPRGGYAITDSQGKFSFRPVDGENTITATLTGFWEQGSTPLSYTFSYPGAASEFQFGIKRQIVKDLAVSLVGTAVRPGFDANFYVTVRNEGSTATDANVSLDYDAALTYVSSEVAPTINEPGHLEWTLPGINSLQSRTVQTAFNLPPTVPLGTVLRNAASVDPINGETEVSDNLDSLKITVTGSFDPNDKLVREGILEERFVEIGTKLTYTIRFQNTGTDTAFVVKIKDELDPHFDLLSLEILASSHPMTYKLDGRLLTFIFQDIELPDSTRNEPKSHGFVRYRIGPFSSVLNNTVVKNSAAIYFDFNEPVETNEVTNKYVTELPVEVVLGTEATSTEGVKIYPNPVEGVVYFQTDISRYSKAELISTTGKLATSFQPASGSNSLDVSQIPPGLYVLRLSGQAGTATVRIVISNN